VNACTSITRSYLAHARVLATTLREHDPAATRTVLVVDDRAREVDGAGEPFEVLRLEDLGIDASELSRLAAIYRRAELSVAVKPRLLGRLLDRGGPVVFLDADVEVFGPLGEVAELAAERSLVLAPHGLEPIPADGMTPSAVEVARAGVFSAGLIGVGQRARAFLSWWAEAVRRDCVVDPARGLHMEQSWLSHAPNYFEHAILRDPGHNVIYWNLHRRQLRWSGGRYEIDGVPLRSFHYTGFDPERPDRVSIYQGPRPRVTPADYPDLARLCRGYSERLLAAGYRDAIRTPYGWGTAASGLRLTNRLRRLYRDALVRSEHTGSPSPPDPFDPGQANDFARWLEDPDPNRLLTVTERASFLIERGPFDLQGSARGARAFRRAILRVIRSYADHQRQVDRALLESIRDVEKRIDAGDES
jgi:hypothetical protein